LDNHGSGTISSDTATASSGANADVINQAGGTVSNDTATASNGAIANVLEQGEAGASRMMC
jgi:hypothetical protein